MLGGRLRWGDGQLLMTLVTDRPFDKRFRPAVYTF